MINEVHLIDCMELMAKYPDRYFDLAVVDPPYGIGINVNMGRRKGDKKSSYHKFYGGDKSIPNSDYWNDLFRVSKNQIVWGGNYMSDKLYASPCWLIWDKMQEFSGAVFEMAWTSFKSPAKAFRMSRVEAYTNQTKIHPTQKPVKLYDWIYKNYLYCKTCNNTGSYYEDVCGDGGSKMLLSCEDCAVGEGRNYRVLDTHVGSGSNRIAAHKAGNIDFIGAEIDREYWEAQEKRYNEFKKQLTLF